MGGQTLNLKFVVCHFGNIEHFIAPHLETRSGLSFPRASYDISTDDNIPLFVCLLTLTPGSCMIQPPNPNLLFFGINFKGGRGEGGSKKVWTRDILSFFFYGRPPLWTYKLIVYVHSQSFIFTNLIELQYADFVCFYPTPLDTLINIRFL